jgi:uncharacterized protein (DUF433 family)
MRIRVGDVLDLLSNGLSVEQVLEEMSDMDAEDIRAALQFAARRIGHAVVMA